MQELYVGHGSAPVLVAYLRVPTSHCPHGPGMDNFEIVLNDYADDNLGEDTPSSNALWSQAFGPDPTSARPDAGIPQQPQQLSAATHTHSRRRSSLSPVRRSHPSDRSKVTSGLRETYSRRRGSKISRETSRIQGVLPINCWSHLCSSSSSSSSSNSSNSSNSNISSSSSSSNSSKMDQL